MHLAIVLGILITAVAPQEELKPPAFVSPAIITDKNNTGVCPLETQLEATRRMLSDELKMILRNEMSTTPMCGDGVWTEVVDFDLTNSSKTCPDPWITVTSPSRLCTSSSCQNSIIFNVSLRYSRVCGEVIGYARGYPDAFRQHFNSNTNIESGYLDGVSITHGSPRQHIWSFAVGHGTGQFGSFYRCPCDNNDASQAPDPPEFVQDNYFCDGLYNGFLWDGEGCTTECCTFHSPPWFSILLPDYTTDTIEVRICSDESVSDEQVYIKKITLFVQ